MHRRQFMMGAAAMAALMAGGARGAKSRPLTFDAMGEVRFEYSEEVIRAMKASGMDAITITLCDPKSYEEAAYKEAVTAVREHDAYFAKHPQHYLKATTVADLDKARAAGQIAIYYLFQNSTQFGHDLNRVDEFYDMGVRSAQITYNHQNWAGSGCKELGANGLTEFGQQLIERMNAKRMLIDLSHANMKTMADSIAASKAPVVISHTACAALFKNVRNTTDENLKALADKGGVVGMCQMRPFMTTLRKGALPVYFQHIAHAVKVAGADHVAIGSDRDHRVIQLTPEYMAEVKREEGPNFNPDQWPLFIDELNGPRRMEVVWDGVRKLGLPSADVEKIMGGNLRRLYTEVIG
ncbi:dipeptidase [Sphingoaurantiacus capsulatus]|uniref:Dipeptidase n=1 Tax=Sphingoaurantiacus capsulatus TaxID=1771310 RepID=A0ABV7X486_9SPHN